MTQGAEAHAASGGVAHFTILQMEPRVRKQVEVAGVVIMQMGDDDIVDRFRLNFKTRQRLRRIERKLAVSQDRFFRIEPGIDQDFTTAAPDQPHKIVEVGGRGLVRVGRDEIHVGGARRHGGVAKRVNFVGRFHRNGFFMFGRWQQATAVSKGQILGEPSCRA